MQDFRYYAALYLRLLDAARTRKDGLESVRNVADAGFTLQQHVTLAAVRKNNTFTLRPCLPKITGIVVIRRAITIMSNDIRRDVCETLPIDHAVPMLSDLFQHLFWGQSKPRRVSST